LPSSYLDPFWYRHLRDDEGMSKETGETAAAEKWNVPLKKLIVPFDEGDPAQEPLFINYTQVAQAGGSVYIDVGVVPLDDILQRSSEATFSVLTRLVMSPETLAGLNDQIASLLQESKYQQEKASGT
jgi:hypothetical protein